MLEIKKYGEWTKDTVSTLVDFKILKFTGSLLVGNRADVQLIYKNGNSVTSFGDPNEVYPEAIKRISLKKNHSAKEKMLNDFDKAWNTATVYGWSEYKKISGTKNPFELGYPINKFVNDYYYGKKVGAKLLQSKLTERGLDISDIAAKMQELGKKERQKQSTTYSHFSGKNEVSRQVAVQYADILDCDPVDLMFPKKTCVVWGKVNTQKVVETYKTFIPGEIYPYTIAKETDVVDYVWDKDVTPLQTVVVPRDIYQKNIKAIQVDARGTMYDQQVAFYYYSNEKDESCLNKLCVVGMNVVSDFDPDYKETLYHFGLYENHKGQANLINPDPFCKEEDKYILKNFEPAFISPIVCMLNQKAIINATQKINEIPIELFNEEANLKAKLNAAKQIIYEATLKQRDIDKTHNEAKKIIEDLKKVQEQTRLISKFGKIPTLLESAADDVDLPSFLRKEDKKSA